MITLFIDKQEKKPLDFAPHASITNTFKSNLPYGDYAAHCNDVKIPYVFERKSKADLWQTLGGKPENHKRFKREIERARVAGSTLVLIIECSLLEILKGHKYRSKGESHKCKFGGLAMVRKLHTMEIRYGLRFICCKNREEMALYISEKFRSLSLNLER